MCKIRSPNAEAELNKGSQEARKKILLLNCFIKVGRALCLFHRKLGEAQNRQEYSGEKEKTPAQTGDILLLFLVG
jgi:hypothetical protein